MKAALAAGWKPVPGTRAANPEQAPPGAIALYARRGRLAWLLETPRGFELDVGNAQSRLQLAVDNRCCICRGPLDIGPTGEVTRNNAAPIANGDCCNMCNGEHVIPARLRPFGGAA